MSLKYCTDWLIVEVFAKIWIRVFFAFYDIIEVWHAILKLGSEKFQSQHFESMSISSDIGGRKLQLKQGPLNYK